MFQGESCYPMSPMSPTKDAKFSKSMKIDENDQLIKILEVLGKQKEQNMTFIDEESKQKYLYQL